MLEKPFVFPVAIAWIERAWRMSLEGSNNERLIIDSSAAPRIIFKTVTGQELSQKTYLSNWRLSLDKPTVSTGIYSNQICAILSGDGTSKLYDTIEARIDVMAEAYNYSSANLKTIGTFKLVRK